MRISLIPDMPTDFELVFFGDDQEGNVAKAHDKFAQCVDYICSDKRRYGIHMGDACDAFWVDDKRHDTFTTTATPLEQLKEEKRQLLPLAKTGRLLSILEGNHERALCNKVGNFSGKLVEELQEKSPNGYPIEGTYSQKIEFHSRDNKPMFKIYLTHGRRSITSTSPDPHRRKAYLQFRLKRLLENMSGDCICMVRGHSHIVLVTRPIPTLYLSSERGRLQQHYTTAGTGSTSHYIPPEHRFFGCSGSFLRSQMPDITTYSETGEYEPVELGYLKGIVKNRQFVDLQEVKI